MIFEQKNKNQDLILSKKAKCSDIKEVNARAIELELSQSDICTSRQVAHKSLQEWLLDAIGLALLLLVPNGSHKM